MSRKGAVSRNEVRASTTSCPDVILAAKKLLVSSTVFPVRISHYEMKREETHHQKQSPKAH